MRISDDLWRYEMVRLREQDSRPLDDHRANEAAIRCGADAQMRLLARASELSRTGGLEQARQKADRVFRKGLVLLCVLSIMAGVSAGIASLGDTTRPVNVLWALGSLLLLPSITLLVWLITLFLGSGAGGWLGFWVQALAGRVLSRGPTAYAWQAWLRLAERAGADRWWFAVLTHGIWLCLLSGMALSLIAAFSFRHYTFVWQTTWLSDAVFVQAAQAVGAIPAQLGFTMPDIAAIRASGNVAQDEPAVRLAWANWLVGALLVFGWFPRLLLLLASTLVLRRRYAVSRIDLQEAYALNILRKLDRQSARSEVDAAPGPLEQWTKIAGIDPAMATTAAALVVLETRLPPEVKALLPEHVIFLPPIDDLDSRHQAIDRLRQIKPAKLLVVVDARQTPDRGVLRTLHALGERAAQTRVFLSHGSDARARLSAWAKQLENIGLQIQGNDAGTQLAWLGEGHA